MGQEDDAGFRSLERHADRVLLGVGLLSVAAFVATLPLPRSDGMVIGCDGLGYYAYVRSLVMDGDLDFTNEYERLYPGTSFLERTPTGLPANPFAVGPAVLWMPFFVAGHTLALVLDGVGIPVATDGFGPIDQAGVCLGSVVYGIGGLVLMHRTARRLAGGGAVLAVVALWSMTNLGYYLVIEPSMSHMCSLFATALMMYLWVRARPAPGIGAVFFVGLAGGLMALVRLPDAGLLLLPLLDWTRTPGRVGIKACRLAALGLGFLAVFWVQMAVWYHLNGSCLRCGYFAAGDRRFDYASPHFLDVLFSQDHGLFLWHPVLLVAVFGLVLFTRSSPWLGGLFLLGFLGQAYVIGSWFAWKQGDAFGGRMFLACHPLFAIGLAAAAARLGTGRRPRLLALGTGGLLVVWNVLFLVQYRTGFIPPGGPYTMRQLTWGKLEMVATLTRRLFP